MKNKIKNSPKLILLIRYSAQFFYMLQDFIIFFNLSIKKIFQESELYDKPLRIITGSDSSHFKSSIQLIESLLKTNKNIEIVFYDLGLQISEIDELNNFNIEYKKFDFNNYPKFIELSQPDAGAYGWKPQILKAELNKTEGIIIWMDAGNVVFKSLEKLKTIILNIGFYSPLSNGYVYQWTHNTTLDLLNIDSHILRKRMLNAAIIGLNTQNNKYKEFILNWSDLALKKEYILPEGAGKTNHRWDQSLLTLIFYKKIKKRLFPRTHKYFGILTHQDID